MLLPQVVVEVEVEVEVITVEWSYWFRMYPPVVGDAQGVPNTSWERKGVARIVVPAADQPGAVDRGERGGGADRIPDTSQFNVIILRLVKRPVERRDAATPLME